jgi:translation initiation factor 2 alpha subunit (eIF-2alpha)
LSFRLHRRQERRGGQLAQLKEHATIMGILHTAEIGVERQKRARNDVAQRVKAVAEVLRGWRQRNRSFDADRAKKEAPFPPH